MLAEQHGDAAEAGRRSGVGQRTFRPQYVVVLACHNQASVNRLLEVQDLFRGDFRFRFVCALSGASRFPAGVERLLRQAGVDQIVPWSALEHEHYDLMLSASENIDFTTTSGPVVLLPHGVGFNKTVREEHGLAGLPSKAALRTGRVHVVLSHPEQEAQIRAACPEVDGHTLVTGDPTFDRLVASMPLRDRYRRLLGVGDRRLVLVTSTWGEESALGRHHHLPRRLLAELPCDSYRVCVVGHPNIWAEHDARQLAIYFADELDAGLLLIPPESGWHAALVAADHVITDHGSLALYSAGLGKPLLLTEPAAETVPGTPVEALHHVADHLDLDGDLRAQLDTTTHDAARFDHITDRVFAHRGHATERLQDALYRLLDLDPPETGPALRRAPDADPWHYRQASAFRVRTETTALGTVTVDRRPAAVYPSRDAWHLVVEEGESDLRLAEQASVLCREFRTDPTAALAWARSAFDAFPFAGLAAGGVQGGGAIVVIRDGRHALVTSTNPQVEVSVLASVAYHCLLAGQFDNRALTVEIGAHSVPVRLEVSPDPVPPAAA